MSVMTVVEHIEVPLAFFTWLMHFITSMKLVHFQEWVILL